MKPQNKFQKRVVKASRTLPALTEAQIQWGYDNAVEHIGQRTGKGVITCTKCGHSWQGGGHLLNVLLGNDCPQCKAKLNVETTKKRIFNKRWYMTVITAHKGLQVVRAVQILVNAKVGEPAKYDYSEVMQRWIAPDGKYCTLALLRQTMGNCYVDSWIFNSDLELRSENSNNKFCLNVYDRIYTGEIYPRMKFIPEIKRTGIKRNFYEQKPLNLFRVVLTDPRAETLIKAGYTQLLTRIMDSGWKKIDNYWPAIRIAIRNGYKINDSVLWCDYIDMLIRYRKDVRNAVYVCPANLKAEHDRYVVKCRRDDEIERQERERQWKIQQEEWRKEQLKQERKKKRQFNKLKAKFIGLQFSDGNLLVRVLESIEDYREEGKAMHHCVSSYWQRENSLVLSATIDGQRIETVEVSLKDLKVIQCSGVCNQNTEHHDHIVHFVNSNMHLIQQRLTA